MTPEKKQLLRFTAAFGVLMFLIVSLVVFSPLRNYALAYLNSYSKNTGDLVTKDMWNNLDDDFGGGVAIQSGWAFITANLPPGSVYSKHVNFDTPFTVGTVPRVVANSIGCKKMPSAVPTGTGNFSSADCYLVFQLANDGLIIDNVTNTGFDLHSLGVNNDGINRYIGYNWIAQQ